MAGARLNPSQDRSEFLRRKRKLDNKVRDEEQTRKLKDQNNQANRNNADLQKLMQHSNTASQGIRTHSTQIIPKEWLAPPFVHTPNQDISVCLLTVDPKDMRISDIPTQFVQSYLLPVAQQLRTNTPPERPYGMKAKDLEQDSDWQKLMKEHRKGPNPYHVQAPVIRVKAICSNGCEVATFVYGVRPHGKIPIPESWSREILAATFPEDFNPQTLRAAKEKDPFSSDTKYQLPTEQQSNWTALRKQRDERLQANPVAKKFCEQFKEALELRVQREDQAKYKQLRFITGDYTSASILKVTPMLRESIWGYNHNEQLVLFEITFAVTKVKQIVRKVLTSQFGLAVGNESIQLREDELMDFVKSLDMQFLVDYNLTGMTWFTLPAGKYTLVTGRLPEEELFGVHYLQESNKVTTDIFAGIDVEAARVEAKMQAEEMKVDGQHSIPPETKQSLLDDETGLQLTETKVTDEERAFLEHLQERSNRDEEENKQVFENSASRGGDSSRKTWLRAEFHILAEHIQSHYRASEPRWQEIPNFCTLSYDLECKGANGHFPRPGRVDQSTGEILELGDPVICIGVVEKLFHGGKRKLVITYKIKRRPGVHDAADPNDLRIEGATVIMCNGEVDMLLFFADLIRNRQPSIITGYNIDKFDWRYLFDRACVLGISTFALISPFKECAMIKESIYQSSAQGQQQRYDFVCPALVSYDLMRRVVTELKFKSNTLNYASQKILKQTKNDVSHHLIPELWMGTNEERARLMEYCIQDCNLVINIEWHPTQQDFVRQTQICRVTGVTYVMLNTKGQGCKTESQLARLMRVAGFVAPNKSRSASAGESNLEDIVNANGDINDSFTGAHCMVGSTPISLVDGTFTAIENIRRMDSVLGYFNGTLEKPCSEDFISPLIVKQSEVAGKGVISAQVKLVIPQPVQKPCVKVTLMDGRELVVTPDHRLMNSEGIYVQAGHLVPGADWLKCSLLGSNSPLYSNLGDSKWELKTDIGTFTNLGFDDRVKLYALGQIIGATVTDGTISRNHNGWSAVMARSHRLDAEQMVLWVKQFSGQLLRYKEHAPKESHHLPFYTVTLPMRLSQVIRDLVELIDKGSRRIPSIMLKDDTPTILLRGFIRGLFGGDGETFQLARGHKNHNSRFQGVGFVQSADTAYEIELDAYFDQLRRLLLKFGVESRVEYAGFKARWPVNDANTNENRKEIKGVLKALGISSAQIHELIGAYAGNGGRVEMHLSLWGLVANRKFAQEIGFGACIHKQTRLEAGLAVYEIRDRLKQISEMNGTEAFRIYGENSTTMSWKQAAALSKQTVEDRFGCVAYQEPWQHLSDEFVLYHRGYSLRKRKDRTNTNLCSSLWPKQIDIAKEIGVYQLFDNSSDENVPGCGKRSYAIGKTSMLIPDFKLKVVKIENVGPQTVYDLEVPLTSSFLAQGIVAHNCLAIKAGFYSYKRELAGVDDKGAIVPVIRPKRVSKEVKIQAESVEKKISITPAFDDDDEIQPNEPIATLDFASLYPSIMIAYNLCYSTILLNPDIDRQRLRPEDVECILIKDKDGKLEKTFYYVKAWIRQGFLPLLVNYLLTFRNDVKKLIAAATARGENTDLLEALSLALKLAANSAYGFPAAFLLFLQAISECVCAIGRYGLEDTQHKVETEFCPANGYAHQAVIIAGDTDSVMIKFGVPSIKECNQLAFKAQKLCNQLFRPPIKLEFEKVIAAALYMIKKNYLGNSWEPGMWEDSWVLIAEMVGPWKPTQAYKVGDAVIHDAKTYAALTVIDAADSVPKNGVQWLCIYENRTPLRFYHRGPHNNSRSYAAWDVVEFLGKTYACTVDVPVNSSILPDCAEVVAESGLRLWQCVHGKKYKPKKITKGIESQRRDKIRFIQRLIEEGSDRILEIHPISKIMRWMRDENEKLCKNEYDMSEIIQSKSQKISYSQMNTQQVITANIARRDGADMAPRAGDRVFFVPIKSNGAVNNYEKMEDPFFALSHNLPIDYQRIGESCVINAERRLVHLLIAPHEKNEVKRKEIVEREIAKMVAPFYTTYSTVDQAQGGQIMKYTKVLPRCRFAHCNVHLDRFTVNSSAKRNGMKVLCDKHAHHYSTLLEDEALKVKLKQTESTTIWDGCNKCVGPKGNAKECPNKDCSQFWKRIKVDADLDHLSKTFANISLDW